MTAHRATDARSPLGRNRITPRAISRVAQAVVARSLDVDPKRVNVALADWNGQLEVRVRSPFRVTGLDEIGRDRQAVERTGGTILQRASAAEGRLREEIGELTGSRVAWVDLQLTSADILVRERVQ